MSGKKVKGGQVWTLDYLVGLIIFISVIFTTIFLIRNYYSEGDHYDEVSRESDHIAAILLSEELVNQSVNTSPVIIATNNRINKTLLSSFDNLTYNQKKMYLQSKGDFVVYFYNGSIINESSCFRGYESFANDCELSLPSSAENIAKTERLVILNSKIVKMIVITWN